jgi:hypothetical protein
VPSGSASTSWKRSTTVSEPNVTKTEIYEALYGLNAVGIDNILDFLSSVIREEVADIERLSFIAALDERADFDDFVSDIAVPVYSYRFLDDLFSIFCIDRHISSPFRLRKAKHKSRAPKCCLRARVVSGMNAKIA